MKLSINEAVDYATNTVNYIIQTLFINFNWESITTELIKTIFTAILGFITFKIYQGYKNKKENTILYIHLLRLKNEANSNLLTLRAIINDFNELENLKMKFNLNVDFKIYSFFSKIQNISIFLNEVPVHDHLRNIVAMDYEYGDYAYSLIDQLEGQIRNIMSEDENSYEELNDLKEQLKALKRSNIYAELEKLVSYKEKVLSFGILTEPLEYFFSEVTTFLISEDKFDSRVLNTFCYSLFDHENIFSQALKEHSRLSSLRMRLTKPKVKNIHGIKNTIEFNLWKNDETQLLAVFSIESYLKLDELYVKNNKIEFYLWDIEFVKSIINLIESEIVFSIDDSIKFLGKTVKRTNKLFKGI